MPLLKYEADSVIDAFALLSLKSRGSYQAQPILMSFLSGTILCQKKPSLRAQRSNALICLD